MTSARLPDHSPLRSWSAWKPTWVRYTLGYVIGVLALVLLVLNTGYVVRQLAVDPSTLSVFAAAVSILGLAPVLVPVWLVSNYLGKAAGPPVANVVEGGMLAVMGWALVQSVAGEATAGAELLTLFGWALAAIGTIIAVAYPLAYRYGDRLVARLDGVIGS
jgi:hypothetical protein